MLQNIRDSCKIINFYSVFQLSDALVQLHPHRRTLLDMFEGEGGVIKKFFCQSKKKFDKITKKEKGK